jgi:hypothetical protein
MTQTPQRRQLPLVSSGPHGSRSHLTCQYRCGNACDRPIPNQTGHPEFRDVAASALARRSVLKGGAVAAGALALYGATTGPVAASPMAGGLRRGPGRTDGVGSHSFAPVLPNTADEVTVPSGYRSDVVIAWGDPVLRDAPEFDVDRQTPEAAARQFGYNCDYVGVIPGRGDRALMVVNHEYTDEQLMIRWPPTAWPSSRSCAAAVPAPGSRCPCAARGRTAGSLSTLPSGSTVPPPGTRGCAPLPTRSDARCWGR